MKPLIRTITLGVAERHPLPPPIVAEFAAAAGHAETAFRDAGYEVQTTRLSTRPMAQDLSDRSPAAVVGYVHGLGRVLDDLGLGFVSLGPLPPDRLALADDVLAASEAVSCSTHLVTQGHGPDPEVARLVARTFWRLAEQSADGLANFLFAGWILYTHGHALRGDAKAAALVLFLCVAFSVTAIPVLARMLVDGGILTSEPGRLAMTAVIVLDPLTWLLLAVAIGLARGPAGVLLAVCTLAAGGTITLVVRRLLPASPSPWVRFVVVVLLAVVAAKAMQYGGLTDMFGAVLAGLAIPGSGWTSTVQALSRFGRLLLPAFFVVFGVTVFSHTLPALSCTAVVMAIMLAITGKLVGSYLGGRLDGATRPIAGEVAVLMCTQGLTELVVLQIAYEAGLLSSTLLTVLVVMALFTTVMVWPAYAALDRLDRLASSAVPSGSATAEGAVGSADFRTLMSTFPTGVAVVASLAEDGRPWGMTCSSVCGVATDPPTLLVCLRQGSPTLCAALRRAAFAVNLLHHVAVPTAQLFASGDPDRFGRIEWNCDPEFGGPHLVRDAHAIADCRVVDTLTVGDHVVVFGEVFGIERPGRPDRTTPLNGARPLVYGLRRYSSWPLDEYRSPSN